MTDAFAPSRARTDRATDERWARRRRNPATLDRMAGSNLGIPDECKDPAYRYYWANDVRNRLIDLTMNDDWDVVTLSELEDNARRNTGRGDFTLNKDLFGGGGQVRKTVERDGTQAVLIKKPQDFCDHDYEEDVQRRQDMMEARVYHGAITNDIPEGAAETLSEEVAYVPKGNTLGDTAPRRRGRIPNRLK